MFIMLINVYLYVIDSMKTYFQAVMCIREKRYIFLFQTLSARNVS